MDGIYENKINAICREIAMMYKKQLEDDDAVATGALLQSVNKWNTVLTEDSFELFFNLPEYWKFSPEDVYKGKGIQYNSDGKQIPPPRAMVESIKKWIDAKGLNLNEYAVSKNIQKNGWRNQPRENLKKVMESFDFEQAEMKLEEILAEAIINDKLNNILDNI